MSIATRIKHKLRTMRPRKWPQGDEALPWFDQPGADATSIGRDVTPEERQLLQNWINDGYVVIPQAISADRIDRMVLDLDSLWTADSPIAGLRVDQLKVTPDGPVGISHVDLLKIDYETRLKLRANEPWRVHGFHSYSTACNSIFKDASLRQSCSLIFAREAEPHYSINFTFGTEQDLHQDTAVFHLHPRNYLIGAWLACEDVDEDCGPLVFYPGSHRTPMYAAFSNYPQTNLRTCSRDVTESYQAWRDAEAAKFERKVFVAKKGDVLLWHGMLAHGGSPIKRAGATRKSYVCHFLGEGTDRGGEIKGPFNW